MRLVCVSGTRGSGKTTLIREIVDQLWTKGFRSAVVVNEDGETPYDQEFVLVSGAFPWQTFLTPRKQPGNQYLLNGSKNGSIPALTVPQAGHCDSGP